ncbi:MAG: type II toxin-antitoxin system YafQ family toxin [Parachlamydiaceae bacterium]
MLKPTPTTKFKKDLKKYKYQIKIIHDLDVIIKLLVQQLPLEQRHADHPLAGNWKGSRECHVNPDVLLIYRIEENSKILFLERFGSHSELF